MYHRQLLQCSPIKPPKPTLSLRSARLPSRSLHYYYCIRRTASSSSKRWQTRQGRDRYAINAKVQGLKSRAAYKLLEINEKFKIFKPGQTVVDLGYAPGSWSQVAVDRTSPNGQVVGIDVIPAKPPTGVSTIQGNFLSAAVHDEVKRFLQGTRQGKPRRHPQPSDSEEASWYEDELEASAQSYLEHEKQSGVLLSGLAHNTPESASMSGNAEDRREGRMVDVVLSDMSAPWEQTEGFWKRSLSDPYYRMMNTSGINFRDHAGSMCIQDLCDAALRFASATLRVGGHFICKFYQGSEDKALEGRLRALFSKVHREKPESSRNVRL
ncbi:MAG: hypothetical protein Q9179_006717 [Wetmoreana sp. 5 TL-2023]